MTTSWRSSQPQLPSHSVEIENRVTTLEVTLEHVQEASEDYHEQASEAIEEVDSKHEAKSEAISKRLSIHEKAILLLAGALQIVAQDKYPSIAKIIRGILTP
jgi:hypothetical protein